MLTSDVTNLLMSLRPEANMFLEAKGEFSTTWSGHSKSFLHGSCCSLQDFHIEVSPGSYTITAGLHRARQQAQRVSLNAGESITLNFDLSPLS